MAIFGRNRFSVGDLRIADLGLNLEFSDNARDNHIEMQFSHASNDDLARLFILMNRKVGSSRARISRASFNLSRSERVLGSIATDMTGSGKHLFREVLDNPRYQGYRRSGLIFQPYKYRNISCANRLYRLALIGVHTQKSGDALTLFFGVVIHN